MNPLLDITESFQYQLIHMFLLSATLVQRQMQTPPKNSSTDERIVPQKIYLTLQNQK